VDVAKNAVTVLPAPEIAGAPADPVQVKFVGELLHAATRVTVVAVPELSELGDAVNVQTGVAANGVTVTCTTTPAVPDALVALSEYEYVPAAVLAGNEAVTLLPDPVTAGVPNDPLQAYEVGAFVQDAARVTVVAVPATKVFGVAVAVQDGGPAEVTVTGTVATGLVPEAPVAVTLWR
jgi:hypothetical protein